MPLTLFLLEGLCRITELYIENGDRRHSIAFAVRMLLPIYSNMRYLITSSRTPTCSADRAEREKLAVPRSLRRQ